MHLKQLCDWLCISSLICWHTWILKHLGQTKERKTALAMGLRIVITKSLKTLRMTRLRGRVLLRARPEMGEGEKG